MWLTEGCGGRRRAVATPNRESRKERRRRRGKLRMKELFVSVKVFGSTVSVSCGIQSVCTLQLFSKLSLCMLFHSF